MQECRNESVPFYTIGNFVAFGAVKVALIFLSFLGYFLVTCIAFHKPYSYRLIQHKLSLFIVG
jgi:hypothetical protein